MVLSHESTQGSQNFKKHSGSTVQAPEPDILLSLNSWPKLSCLITHTVAISNIKRHMVIL